MPEYSSIFTTPPEILFHTALDGAASDRQRVAKGILQRILPV